MSSLAAKQHDSRWNCSSAKYRSCHAPVHIAMCSLVMKWLSLFAMRTAGLMMTVALSFVVPSAVGQVVDDHIPESEGI